MECNAPCLCEERTKTGACVRAHFAAQDAAGRLLDSDPHVLSALLPITCKLRQVLHMDRNDYYGGESASVNLTQLFEKFKAPPNTSLGEARAGGRSPAESEGGCCLEKATDGELGREEDRERWTGREGQCCAHRVPEACLPHPHHHPAHLPLRLCLSQLFPCLSFSRQQPRLQHRPRAQIHHGQRYLSICLNTLLCIYRYVTSRLTSRSKSSWLTGIDIDMVIQIDRQKGLGFRV